MAPLWDDNIQLTIKYPGDCILPKRDQTRHNQGGKRRRYRGGMMCKK
eukprot:gene10124-2290_t